MKLFGTELRGGHLRPIAQLGQAAPVRLPGPYKGDLVHRLVVILLIFVAATAAIASETTQIVDAKIAETTARGFILQVGSESLTLEDTPSTKFWRDKNSVERTAFNPGDLVTVRVKTNTDPPELREMADRATWKWVDACRKEPQAGQIVKVDDKYLTIRLADGSTFAYRATDKSKVSITGMPNASVTDLQVGQRVYVKGRTLATLDTWLAEVTDVPIPAKPTKESKGRKTKAQPLPAHGKIEGMVLARLPQYRMFDMIDNALTLHITYRDSTKFYLDGRAVGPAAIQPQQKVVVSYSRDKYGRLVASKVELFRR